MSLHQAKSLIDITASQLTDMLPSECLRQLILHIPTPTIYIIPNKQIATTSLITVYSLYHPLVSCLDISKKSEREICARAYAVILIPDPRYQYNIVYGFEGADRTLHTNNKEMMLKQISIFNGGPFWDSELVKVKVYNVDSSCACLEYTLKEFTDHFKDN